MKRFIDIIDNITEILEHPSVSITVVTLAILGILSQIHLIMQ